VDRFQVDDVWLSNYKQSSETLRLISEAMVAEAAHDKLPAETLHPEWPSSKAQRSNDLDPSTFWLPERAT
jgi:hypothetical protein